MIGSGPTADIGLSIMQLGMITGLHAAISPSIFTFACFAKKPEECAIARKTLWISGIATTVVNVGTLLVFGRWAPAIVGQIVGIGLFGLGMQAVASNESAPAIPSMAPKVIEGMGRIGYNPTRQPETLYAQSHWLDRRFPDRYETPWDSQALPMR
jgi:hypothetical protein